MPDLFARYSPLRAALKAATLAAGLVAILAALVIATAPPAPEARAESAPPDPVVVTVLGEAVGSPNRGPLDPFDDAFFAFQGVAFAKAHGLTLADLAAMEPVTIAATFPGGAPRIEATGPRLADVLAKAGVAAEASIEVTALDGYTIRLQPEDREAQDWILATEVDGRPLGLGGRGPAWLIHATQDRAASPEEEARWVWSVVAIRAE